MRRTGTAAMMLMTCYQSIGDEDDVQAVSALDHRACREGSCQGSGQYAALAGGANALAILGEQARARDWIDRALLLDPDNTLTRYNLACALALRLKDADRAIEVLEPYFEQEVSPAQIKHLEVDPDLDPIRDHSRFKTMLAGAKQRLGMNQSLGLAVDAFLAVAALDEAALRFERCEVRLRELLGDFGESFAPRREPFDQSFVDGHVLAVLLAR